MSISKETIRNHVAGAARWLWLEHGEESRDLIMSTWGSYICYTQAINYLGQRMDACEYQAFCRMRRVCAEAAYALWCSRRNVSEAWLKLTKPENIIDRAKLAAMLDSGEDYKSYREQHGSRVIAAPGWSLDESRDSAVADAAQWLYLNRNCSSRKIHEWDSEFILRAYSIAKAHDERFVEHKKYSLSDLQRAYDMGFGASGEGWNQEIHPDYINEETYQAERLEALREFK